MALDVVAVESYTQGRLSRDDDETQRQLDAALAAARNYCGWHVTPVVADDEVVLDGPGNGLLMLPTLRLTGLSAIAEDGVAVDVAEVQTSVRGMVRKNSGALWTANFGGIAVTFSHGFDASAAADFEAAILSAISRGGFSADETPRVIGPFQYSDPASAGGVFTGSELAVLSRYRIESAP